jgi:uncharacterized protein
MWMIEKRRSRIQGWGVFATQTIPKNKRIIDYAGEKISNRESLKRERRYIRSGHIWCFKLTNRTVIDAGVGGNVARYINHSCRPNAEVEIKGHEIVISARKTIQEGDEITYNYGRNYFNAYIKDKGCLCTHCHEKRKAARAERRVGRQKATPGRKQPRKRQS